MCIAIIKPKGVKPPDEPTLRNCFDANPHGAGFMYAKHGFVYIQKGYMTFADFNKAYKSANIGKRDVIVYHFRIATHGAVDAGDCHPFPLSDDPKYLRHTYLKADMGIAHNGMIDLKEERPLSDTATFIKQCLYPLRADIRNRRKEILPLLSVATGGSKMAFLYHDGEYVTTGKWITDKGVLYSNDSYKGRAAGYFSRSYVWDYNRDDYSIVYDGETDVEICDICDSRATTSTIFDDTYQERFNI
jgi:predicted glutamine amidotransferase